MLRDRSDDSQIQLNAIDSSFNKDDYGTGLANGNSQRPGAAGGYRGAGLPVVGISDYGDAGDSLPDLSHWNGGAEQSFLVGGAKDPNERIGWGDLDPNQRKALLEWWIKTRGGGTVEATGEYGITYVRPGEFDDDFGTIGIGEDQQVNELMFTERTPAEWEAMLAQAIPLTEAERANEQMRRLYQKALYKLRTEEVAIEIIQGHIDNGTATVREDTVLIEIPSLNGGLTFLVFEASYREYRTGKTMSLGKNNDFRTVPETETRLSGYRFVGITNGAEQTSRDAVLELFKFAPEKLKYYRGWLIAAESTPILGGLDMAFNQGKWVKGLTLAGSDTLMVGGIYIKLARFVQRGGALGTKVAQYTWRAAIATEAMAVGIYSYEAGGHLLKGEHNKAIAPGINALVRLVGMKFLHSELKTLGRGGISPGELLRQKYGHLSPVQRASRIDALSNANYTRRLQEELAGQKFVFRYLTEDGLAASYKYNSVRGYATTAFSSFSDEVARRAQVLADWGNPALGPAANIRYGVAIPVNKIPGYKLARPYGGSANIGWEFKTFAYPEAGRGGWTQFLLDSVPLDDVFIFSLR